MRIERPKKDSHFMFMNASEIVTAAKTHEKWMRHQQGIQGGNMRNCSNAEFNRLVTIGDEKLVQQSEKFLAEVEDQVPMSAGWRNFDDVVGAVPNIPAFLAGHPQCMRRRQRTMKHSAPLTIIMELTSSMGIKKELILQRGIVLLALVRMLVVHRPVELWVGTTLSGSGHTATALWQIDTAPMDLARAAFQIADTSMSRLFGYAMAESLVDKHLGGTWHYTPEQITEILKSVGGWNEILYLPGIKLSDPMVSEPVEWLKRTLSQYATLEE